MEVLAWTAVGIGLVVIAMTAVSFAVGCARINRAYRATQARRPQMRALCAADRARHASRRAS